MDTVACQMPSSLVKSNVFFFLREIFLAKNKLFSDMFYGHLGSINGGKGTDFSFYHFRKFVKFCKGT